MGFEQVESGWSLVLQGQACRCLFEEVEDVMVPLGPSGFSSVRYIVSQPFCGSQRGNVLLGRLYCCAEQVGPWLPGCCQLLLAMHDLNSFSSPLPHRQLLKTELGSFFTEYLQVCRPCHGGRFGLTLKGCLYVI